MKPVIGITSRYSSKDDKYNLPDAYIKAIHRNEGTPIVLPPLYNAEYKQFYDLVDGVLFTGGPDVDPMLYGEQPFPKQGWIEPMRDEFEIKLAKIALAGPKPVLGICRGLQTLNVAAGGTLIQDIGSQIKYPIKHRQEAKAWYGTHHVKLELGSKIHEVFGNDLVLVNSFHHQACKDPAPGFKATGRASDGVIEVLEKEGSIWKLCVQWHPEHMNNPVMNKLFKAFVNACISNESPRIRR
jgi:putative glutamine amidotransferase